MHQQSFDLIILVCEVQNSNDAAEVAAGKRNKKKMKEEFSPKPLYKRKKSLKREKKKNKLARTISSLRV